MPFLTLSEKGEITSTSSNQSMNPLGKRSTFLFNTSGNGVPRGTDLLKVRRLGQSYAVELMKDTVKQQVTTTSFSVNPAVEDPSPEHEEAAEELEKFLKGGFNDNKESFDHLLKKILDDVLDADSGVLELVPDDEGYLNEIYARDGITFTKNIDDHGRLPRPPGPNEGFDEESHAAYYQFGLNSMAQRIISTETDMTMRELGEHLNRFGAQRFNIRAHEPIAFPRDRIVWFSESPKSWRPYGTGKTEKVSLIAETLLKSNLHNLTWFVEDEYADGVLAIEGANQSELEKYREYWRDEVRGNPHELPILGSGGKIDYLNFDPTPQEMEFLESQKWYVKLVAMIFGLNQNEIGDLADINRATAQEQAATVFRRTTKPLLDMIERKINNQILPKTREWDALPEDVPLQFEFQIDHPKMERLKFETDKKKLEANVMTPNELRENQGLDQKGEWADLPIEAIRSIARNHPEWIAEKEGIDDVPTSGFGGDGGIFGSANNDNDDDDTGGSGGSGSSEDGQSEEVDREPRRMNYKQAWDDPGKHCENLKDALRNERSNEFPPLKSHVDQLSKEVGKSFLESKDDVQKALEENWPEKEFEEMSEKDLMARISQIMDSVDLKDKVGSILVSANMEALQESADHQAEKVENELEEVNDSPDAEINIDFDVEDSFAAERMRQRTFQSATEINDAVKDQLRTTLREGQKQGWGTDKIASEIGDKFDDISDNHAKLVARTETLSSSREGSQAMAESTDVVDRKEWIATDDYRTREWHDAMDGEVVKKDQDFVVPKVSDKQPADYPRSTMVVGQDQPFNCRCSQAPVIDDDLRKDGKADWLKLQEEFEALNVELGVTERQFEVWLNHGQEGEDFEDTWKRLAEEKGSVTKLSEIVSRPTVYDWNEEMGVDL